MRLDERVVEHRVLFVAGHVGETSQVCQHGPGAILSVEPQQSRRLWELVRCEVTRDRGMCLAQLCAVATLASRATRAQLCGIDARYPEKLQRNRASKPHNRR